MIVMIAGMAGRRTDAEARDTRAAILARAADIGSVEGLEGITIGRLAGELGMSKAGVIGHFGSKEELQLATLELASEMFRERVWVPAENEPAGLARLLAICDAWTTYARKPPFTGGCFIAAASFEFDGRSGRVHDALKKVTKRWRRTLAAEVETAVRAGELPPETDPEQIAYSLEALAQGAHPARLLQGDRAAAAWSLTAMHALLGVQEQAAAGAPAGR
jgi:AcrR family transcriptional regulator